MAVQGRHLLWSRVATTKGHVRIARGWTYDWWRKSCSMLVVMWWFMRVALSKHLLDVSQGGRRQGGRRQCRRSPVAVATGVATIAHSWVAAIGAIGARQDIKARFWSARGSQLQHRSLQKSSGLVKNKVGRPRQGSTACFKTQS